MRHALLHFLLNILTRVTFREEEGRKKSLSVLCSMLQYDGMLITFWRVSKNSCVHSEIKKKKQAQFLGVPWSSSRGGAAGRTCSRASPTCTLWLSSGASVWQTPACSKRRGRSQSLPASNITQGQVADPTAGLSVNAEVCWPQEEHFGVEVVGLEPGGRSALCY